MTDAADAGSLTRELASTSPGDEAYAEAGLLDDTLPPEIRVEIAYELGRADLARTDRLLGDASLLTAAMLCGAAVSALDLGIAYAQEREVFGKPLARFQVQRHAFALSTARVEAARALARRAATGGAELV